MKKYLPATLGGVVAVLGFLSLILPERAFIEMLRFYAFVLSMAIASILIYLTYALIKVPPPPDPRELEKEYKEELERILKELEERP